MVTRVTAPAEHHLLTNGQMMIRQFGSETLSKFAVERLIENRITSRNFKAGLDFSDSYKARPARKKLTTQIVNYVKKEFGFLYVPGSLHYTFLDRDRYATDVIVVSTMYDKAVLRYIRRIKAFITAKRLPINIDIREWNYETEDKIELVFQFYNSGGRSTLYYYKLFCFIPEILLFFKQLSRKAAFQDQDAKLISRSKFSGWVGIPNPVSNAGDTQSPPSAANGPSNRRGSRAAN